MIEYIAYNVWLVVSTITMIIACCFMLFMFFTTFKEIYDDRKRGEK